MKKIYLKPKPAKQIFAALFIFLTVTIGAQSHSDIDMALHLRLQQMRSSQAPEVYGNSILFTYAPEHYNESTVRTAGIAFAHESYQTVHPFSRITSQGDTGEAVHTGVLFLLYPIPQDMKQLEYRLIVDGLWMVDPKGVSTERKETGITVSVFPVPRIESRVFKSPEIDSNKRVTFRYRGDPGRRVQLSGSFNNWDPFMYRMNENPDVPGLYTITLRLPEGTHFYTFIRDGESITDPLNNRLASRKSGEYVSVVEVGESESIARQ
jgi:hypothetical protein